MDRGKHQKPNIPQQDEEQCSTSQLRAQQLCFVSWSCLQNLDALMPSLSCVSLKPWVYISASICILSSFLSRFKVFAFHTLLQIEPFYFLKKKSAKNVYNICSFLSMYKTFVHSIRQSQEIKNDSYANEKDGAIRAFEEIYGCCLLRFPYKEQPKRSPVTNVVTIMEIQPSCSATSNAYARYNLS